MSTGILHKSPIKTLAKTLIHDPCIQAHKYTFGSHVSHLIHYYNIIIKSNLKESCDIGPRATNAKMYYNNNILFYSANIQFGKNLFSALSRNCVQEHAN